MSKFEKDAKLLTEYIGGKENVAAVTHCATRMRFVLNDTSKADVEKIKAIPCVKGTFTQAGQFQVIIGPEVATFIMILLDRLEYLEKVRKKSRRLLRRI